MSVFCVETEIDLGDIGIHFLDLTAQIKDPDPESMPSAEIKRAVVHIDVADRSTLVDITERIAIQSEWVEFVIAEYVESRTQVLYREPDDDPHSAA